MKLFNIVHYENSTAQDVDDPWVIATRLAKPENTSQNLFLPFFVQVTLAACVEGNVWLKYVELLNKCYV